jgi:predicted metal-dependent TIM-barrel fold hydrolase
MATVITVPRDSSLQFRLVVGTNPETLAPIINSKTFANIKSVALDQDVYDTAIGLVGLQKYTVDEIRLERESLLTE